MLSVRGTDLEHLHARYGNGEIDKNNTNYKRKIKVGCKEQVYIDIHVYVC